MGTHRGNKVELRGLLWRMDGVEISGSGFERAVLHAYVYTEAADEKGMGRLAVQI
jgi:hypothetical protein